MPKQNELNSDSLEDLAREAALLAVESKGVSQSFHYDESEDPSSSEYDSCSSSSYMSSGEERILLSMMPKSNEQLKRCSSMPSFHEGEMSTMQVAILLNQVRIQDEEQQQERKKGPSGRRHSMTSAPSSDMSIVSAPGKLVNKNLPHIQGTGMGASVASSTTEETFVEEPCDMYFQLLKDANYEPRTVPYSETTDFFMKVTADRMNSYAKDVISAVKNSDLNFLRMAHFDLNRNMNCCNRFGESVLHTACRHSNIEVVRFLIDEAKVDIRVCDDFGRTPCHDAAWQGEPNMELVEMIINECPDLLLIADKRGFTPLQYVRKAQWPAWNALLKKSKDKILPKQLLMPTGSFIAVSA